jgi:hypothetical protein
VVHISIAFVLRAWCKPCVTPTRHKIASELSSFSFLAIIQRKATDVVWNSKRCLDSTSISGFLSQQKELVWMCSDVWAAFISTIPTHVCASHECSWPHLLSGSEFGPSYRGNLKSWWANLRDLISCSHACWTTCIVSLQNGLSYSCLSLSSRIQMLVEHLVISFICVALQVSNSTDLKFS